MKYFKLTLLISLLFSNSILIAQSNSTGRSPNAKPGNTISDDKIEIKADDIFVTDRDSKTKDQQIIDDYIVTGSLAVGNDAVLNENFGFNTILLKENNLRIGFDDTSLGDFPANDWALVANSTANAGESYFAIEDVTAGRIPFIVMAGAPLDALRVASNGNVGLSTSNPLLELHITDSDTPGIRLEQDGSGGWTPQTWDVAANEANFFIRDVTNGSALPFRIIPGAPTSSIYINSNGNVGLGTTSPSELLHVTESARIDSSLILGTYNNLPTAPETGEIVLDGTDNNLKFYNGTSWTFLSGQGLTTASLVGTVLDLVLADGQTISVDISPLIQDLEDRVTALEQQISSTKDYLYSSARLFQNYPNPFTDQTSIPVFVPADISNAHLVIYDIKGVKVKDYTISEREYSNVVINNGDIQGGTYFYSLILDNSELESKILIKLD